MELAYYADGSKYASQDQRGCIHTYVYDDLGRPTKDRVTTLGGADDFVQSITYAYDDLGRRQSVKSWSGDDGDGTCRNEVKYTYGDAGWGNVTKSQQDHAGAVGGGEPDVDYTYTAIGAGNDKNIRLTSVEYPSSRDIYYNYPSSGIGAALNRLGNIASSATPQDADKYAQYTYLGAGTIVKVAHPAVTGGLELTYLKTSGSDPYAAFDRFGRVVDQKWQNTAATVKDRYTYGYDTNSNRLYRENTVTGDKKDEIYTYDGLDRLASFKRGDLNANKDAIPTADRVRGQAWTLSQTGNWSDFRLDANGDGDYSDTGAEEVDQSRTHNLANELTGITEQSNPQQSQWASPVFSARGNMTTVPKPSAMTATYSATYV